MATTMAEERERERERVEGADFRDALAGVVRGVGRRREKVLAAALLRSLHRFVEGDPLGAECRAVLEEGAEWARTIGLADG